MRVRRRFRPSWLPAIVISMGAMAWGGGITADVGLTPPVDRWIFRTQVRYMERGDDPTTKGREVGMFAVPVVLVYGLRPNMTIIARQIAFDRRMKLMGRTREATGFGDFTLITKWRALRINRRDYIVGVAPTLGVAFPTGDEDFGSDTWDALTGVYLTARRGPWGSDLNLEYALNGVDERGGNENRPGDASTANLALSYQFTLDDRATMSLWPVLELTYTSTQRDRDAGAESPDTGGNVLSLSPGVKFARQSFILEALIQVPVAQNLHGAQLEHKIGGLVGLRYLF